MRRAAARSFLAIPLALGLLSCDRPVAGPEIVGPLSVQIVSGDAQRGVIGRELPQPVIVKVTDERGRAVKDQLVNFVVVSGGGSVFAGSAITDKQGIAREFWTLGISLATGANVLEVRAVDEKGEKRVYARFTATGIPVPVGSIVLSRTSATIEEGEHVQISATLFDDLGNELDPAGRRVEWLTSNSGVVANNGNGNFSGVAAGGPIAVTASAEGKTATAMITVIKAVVAYVRIDPQYVTIELGSGATFQAFAYGARGQSITGRTFTWTVSDPAALQLTAIGADRATVLSLAEGSPTIQATLDGATASATVFVTRPSAASIEISPTSVSLRVGGSIDLTATVRDTRGNIITDCGLAWFTSAPSAVQIAWKGPMTVTINAIAPVPSGTITANCEGVSGQIPVVVTRVPVGSVTIPPFTTPAIGNSLIISALVRDINGTVVNDRQVMWTTSNPGVVSLATSSGLSNTLTVVAQGTAVITASSEGVTDTETIVVGPAPVASVVIDPPSSTFPIEQTRTFTATVKDAQGNVLTGRTVTWTLSQPSPMFAANLNVVGDDAVVTGVLDGTVTLVAISEGRSASAALTITPLNDPVDTETIVTALNLGALGAGQTVTWSAIFGRDTDVSDWYRVTANDPNACSSGTKTHTLQLALTNIPAGRNYDLFVYSAPGVLDYSATVVGNAAENINIAKTGACGTSLTFTVYIEVRRVFGAPSASPYTLRASVP